MVFDSNSNRRDYLGRAGMRYTESSRTGSQREVLIVGCCSLAVLLVSFLILSIASQARFTECNPLDSPLAQQVIKVAFRPGQTRRVLRRRSQDENKLLANVSSEATRMTSIEQQRDPKRAPSDRMQPNNQPKRFKSSADQQSRQISDFLNSGTNLSAVASNSSASSLDVNNNTRHRQDEANDLNNNAIQTEVSANQQPNWRRNINSINGTIDLSEYAQNDVDRLYGDALLVYLKNFNETLPARRETISLNGSSSQVPIYRSESRVARWI